MKIYIPVLTKYARHGGVTQFLSNFVSSTLDLKENFEIYDHSGRVCSPFSVTTFSRTKSILRKFVLIKSLIIFPYIITRMDHVFLNPSLGKVSMAREMFFARCCSVFKIPYSIFFHGWNWDFSDVLDNNSKLRNDYIKLIDGSSNVFVLGRAFRDKLISWGVDKNKIYLEKTTIPDGFVTIVPPKRFSKSKLNILFLSRVVREKGIFEALDAFSIHLNSYPNSQFSIAGTGEDLNEVKQYVVKHEIVNVSFVGFADECLKKKLLSESDVFILPSYSEGMPISIFEAMAYGLTIITRPVGGIPDFFKIPDMGFLIDSLHPSDISDAMNEILMHEHIRSRVSNFNKNYVTGNVISTVITKKILAKML